jgi:type II secretory pathway pseudopilin PulG
MLSFRVKQAGFGYLTVLSMIVILALVLATTYQQQSKVAQRDREDALLFVGQQYVQALKSYHQLSPEGNNELPETLEALVLDKRFIPTTRHIRKTYIDPITGEAWGLILNEQQKIKGVYSVSNQTILQVDKFKNLQIESNNQEGKRQRYSDIKFVFENKTKKTFRKNSP